MTLGELWTGAGEWLRGSGPSSDIVMSSRIRLARNLRKYPFPHWADAEQLEAVISDFESAYGRIDFFKDALFLRMGELDSLEKQMLIERHLVSREHALRPEHKAVLISDREVISVMVNEKTTFACRSCSPDSTCRIHGSSPTGWTENSGSSSISRIPRRSVT